LNKLETDAWEGRKRSRRHVAHKIAHSHHSFLIPIDLECEEEVLAATARRASDVPSRIWAYEHLIKEVATPSAMVLVR